MLGWFFRSTGKRRVTTVRRGTLHGRRDEFHQHREIARTLAHERLAHFNQFYNFTYARVSIRNQHTRWGSCSRKGNLNFHYKIALLPEHLRDYVIVHELCHLGQMNHSREFWSLVVRVLPDYPNHRRELRRFS